MGLTFTNTAATTAAVTNHFVTSTNMKVGAYTIANASPVWSGGCLVTFAHVSVTGTDTLGTVALVGTDLLGQTISETLTPVADSTVTSTKVYRTVTSVTGAGWVINTGNDTIMVGCAAGNIAAVGVGQLGGVLVNNSVAATVAITDGSRTIMVIPSSQAAGSYYNLHGVDFTTNLKVATTSTNDITVFHTGTVPSLYATA
jgi:hypothetical protein